MQWKFDILYLCHMFDDDDISVSHLCGEVHDKGGWWISINLRIDDLLDWLDVGMQKG